MIIVAFKPLDYRKQAIFTPLILRATSELMNKTVGELKSMVHEHFREYMSPFINQNHLNLSSKQSQSMINNFPLYMYLDSSQFTQYIMCTTQPNTPNQNQLKWRYISNSLIYMVQNQQQICYIPQKQIYSIDERLRNIEITEKNQNIQMIVNANVITRKNEGENWSDLFDNNWKHLVHHNDCIYLKITFIKTNDLPKPNQKKDKSIKN